jgi:ABC-type molybdate transport system substrate-binding protein
MAEGAGLGDETQIHVVLTATALGINRGGNHPKAVNKASVSAAADEPVQNGNADYTISVTATLQPDCTPPMTVSFKDIVLTDTTNHLTPRSQEHSRSGARTGLAAPSKYASHSRSAISLWTA